MGGGQAAEPVDFLQRREAALFGIAAVQHGQLAVFGGTGQMQNAHGVQCVVGGNKVETSAQPVAEQVGVGGTHGLPGQQAAVGGPAPDGFVALPRRQADGLQLVKVLAAECHKIGEPRLAAGHQLAAKVGQHMGRTLRLHSIVSFADGGGHALAGGVGHLVHKDGLAALPPQIIQRMLGVGIQVQHGGVGKVLICQHPFHRAELVVGQRPVGIRRDAVAGEGAVPNFNARIGKLTAVRLLRRGVGDQRYRAGGVGQLGTAKGHHGAAVIHSTAQVGGIALAVALQRCKRAKDQVLHGGPSRFVKSLFYLGNTA